VMGSAMARRLRRPTSTVKSGETAYTAVIGGAVAVKRALGLVVIVALASAVVPSPSFAHGSRGGSSGFRGGHFAGSSRSVVPKRFAAVSQTSVFPQPVDPWKSWGLSPKHFPGGHFAFTPFVGTSGFIGASPVVVVPQALPQVIDPSSVVYAAPPMTAAVALPAPATLPTQTLIDHPGGWYQLRGDGATTPYTWVWIPKPPASPMAQTETPPAARAPDARDSRGPAYRWTDDKGVTTWTNKLERVPKRFRDQAAATAQE
jgi:hypothetical protein